MTLVDRLLSTLAYDGTVVDVRIGLHWTAVVVELECGEAAGHSTVLRADVYAACGATADENVPQSAGLPRGAGRAQSGGLRYRAIFRADGDASGDATAGESAPLTPQPWGETNSPQIRAAVRRAGLAATQKAQDLEHGRPAVREAGRLIGKAGREVAALAASDSPTERSLGFAAINALLEVDELACADRNAEDLILERAAGRKVAIVGHFPFVPKVREVAGACWVLELDPGPGDLPADRASEIIPQADVVAITGMTLINGTFEALAALARSDAYVLILGPSTPLSPVLFEYGVDAISGTLLVDIPIALAAISQGANFRQVPGRRLLTMTR